MKLHTRFLCFCCLFIAQSVAAVEVGSLFTAEVTAHSQSREDRNTAIRDAMLMVLSRFTTSKEFVHNPAVESALDNGASYVDQYQYIQGQGNKEKNPPRLMRITFNKESLMAMLNNSGVAVWGVKRDKTLLWLLIEQKGKQVFLDVDQSAEIYMAVQDAAKANGIPLLFPLMDLEEKQAITVKDILKPSPDKMLAASARYDVATILSGKLVKLRTCWRSEWALHLNNKTEQWTVPCAGLKTNLTNTFQKVYQHLSVFYAVKAEQTVN